MLEVYKNTEKFVNLLYLQKIMFFVILMSITEDNLNSALEDFCKMNIGTFPWVKFIEHLVSHPTSSHYHVCKYEGWIKSNDNCSIFLNWLYSQG